MLAYMAISSSKKNVMEFERVYKKKPIFSSDNDFTNSDAAKLKADINSITSHILSLPNGIDKNKLNKIKLKLEKGFYDKKIVLEKVSDKISDLFLGGFYSGNTAKKALKKKKKYLTGKELIEEFAGIWEGKATEKTSIEFAKELRIMANSRYK